MRAVNPINFVKQRPVTCLVLLIVILTATSLAKIDTAVVNFKKDAVVAAADTYDPKSNLDITRNENRDGDHFKREPWQHVSLFREWTINGDLSEGELKESFKNITQIGGRVMDFSKGDNENEYNATLRLNIDSYNTLMYVQTCDDKFELRVTTE